MSHYYISFSHNILRNLYMESGHGPTVGYGWGWWYREPRREQEQQRAPPELPPQLPFPPVQPAVVYVPVPVPYPFAPFFAPPPPFYPQSPEEELAMLESYRDALARELERVEARIKELKQQLGKS